MKISSNTFGILPNGTEAKLFRFNTSNGLSICITNYGGIITSIKAPDRYGNAEEICAGFNTLDDYLKGHPHFGVIVGRFANRIAKGRFKIGGTEYQLPINNFPNHLHGGDNGFHTKLWNYKLTSGNDHAVLELTYTSTHLEEGYPGNLKVITTYRISDKNQVEILFLATTDAPTHVNLTSHGYFNLNGFKNNVSDHELFIDSIQLLENDKNQIPTGSLIDYKNSPFDFSNQKSLGKALMNNPDGIDHCYVIKQPLSLNKPAARLFHSVSGRILEVYCTQPGIQVYTGNSLDGSLIGHNSIKYKKHGAICLEPQFFPDSPNQPNFPLTLLKPNEAFEHQISLKFLHQ